ncbi:hypothetical protein BDV24DRAFT_145624 [Aspergillus arachidicola]|uniref:Uncharacterized protein n=1 Tax=Aspergillus arachidicola TaxID=656916 RepID=A0A5N6XPE2_9EURO|nr:hypothetical protein BDV24DRAFT_145624 [Aspergillus arachidicola]
MKTRRCGLTALKKWCLITKNSRRTVSILIVMAMPVTKRGGLKPYRPHTLSACFRIRKAQTPPSDASDGVDMTPL